MRYSTPEQILLGAAASRVKSPSNSSKPQRNSTAETNGAMNSE